MPRRVDWEQVGELVAEIKRQGLTFKEGAERAGVPVWKVYEYNKRQKKRARRREQEAATDTTPDSADASPTTSESSSGADAAAKSGERRGRPKIKLPDEVAELIVDYKKEHPDHGYKRIEDWLKSKYMVVVPRKRIREVLKANDLLVDHDSSFDRSEPRQKGRRRFEAAYPGELWQMDHTNVYIEGVSVLYLILIEDDHSRFCVGATLKHSYDGETMIGVLHDAIRRYGRPDKLLTDQGRCFYTWSMGRTRFQKYLDDRRIEHIVSEPHSPQTLGKVERLNQTIKTELIKKVHFDGYDDARDHIARFLADYNYERPHQGIDGLTPSDRFFGVDRQKAKVEAELQSRHVDLSKGYLVFNTGGHTISIVNGNGQLQVYLDGTLLSTGGSDGSRD